MVAQGKEIYMDKVTLSAAMVRRVIRKGLAAGFSGIKVDCNEQIEVYTTYPITVGLTPLKPEQIDTDSPSKVTGVEPFADTVTLVEQGLHCGDTIIVSPCNERGRSIVAKYGNVFRVVSGRSNKGNKNPHTWIITSVTASVAGKFRGSDRKNIAQETLPVSQSDTARWCKVIMVCRFPEVFSWRVYFEVLKNKGVTIEQFNAVNFNT